MSTTQILISGFGGQGVLFAGKFLAYSGLIENKEVSWLPSYGPEMRGGTASVSVIISDAPIGSPIVTTPDILVAMNLPSLDRFESAVAEGGTIIYDSSLIERSVERTDVNAYGIPATKLASDAGIPTLANMIIVGKLLKELNVVSYENVSAAIAKVVSAKRQNLAELNKKAIDIGYEL